MSIHRMQTADQTLLLTNEPGSIVFMGDTYERLNLQNSPGSIVQASGGKWDSVFVNDSPGSIVRMSDWISSININSSNTMSFAYGDSETVTIGSRSWLAGAPPPKSPGAYYNNQVEVFGHNDIVSTGPTAHNTVVGDHGTGTLFSDFGGGMTVRDFASDATAKINVGAYLMTPDQAVAAERSDGHGGTLIGSIDVIGMTHIDVDHFVAF